MVYSQYVEFGEYRYRADRPPFKTYITDDYANLLNVVDSNSLRDRYRTVVVVIDKKSYNIFLNYIKKYEFNQLDSINPEGYQYFRIFDRKKKMSNSYRFSLDGYKLHLIDLFEYIEKNNCIIKEDKNKLISKLKYWQ
jgi:effector-binding domain-containing protein